MRTSVISRRIFSCQSGSRELGRTLATKERMEVRNSLTQRVWLSASVAASSFVTPPLSFRESALNMVQASEGDWEFLEAQDGILHVLAMLSCVSIFGILY